MFKPTGKYIIEPWLSEKGKAVVFVGDAGNEYWDDTDAPKGKSQTFKNPDQLTATLHSLRMNPSLTGDENYKYKEKINFKWVEPLPKGSTPQNWEDWAKTHKIYGWAKDLIREYVEKLP